MKHKLIDMQLGNFIVLNGIADIDVREECKYLLEENYKKSIKDIRLMFGEKIEYIFPEIYFIEKEFSIGYRVTSKVRGFVGKRLEQYGYRRINPYKFHSSKSNVPKRKRGKVLIPKHDKKWIHSKGILRKRLTQGFLQAIKPS